MVLLQDGPELDGGEGPPHYKLDRDAVQSAEDARMDVVDEMVFDMHQVGFTT